MTFDVDLDLPHASKILADAELAPYGKVQTFIDNEVIRRSIPYAPMDTGFLSIQSPILGSDIGSGIVTYAAPYAARLYFNPQYNFRKTHHPNAGAYWVERMWAEQGDDIIAGAEELVNL